jgi:hypothetical protein
MNSSDQRSGSMRRTVIRESPELLGWLAENVPRSIPGASDCHGPWVMPGDVSSRKRKNMMARMPVYGESLIMQTRVLYKSLREATRG